MATLKTTPGNEDVDAFLAAIEDPSRRADCRELARLMRRATGAKPVLWGGWMVGFGTYHYRYASGREGDWFKVGFASGSRGLTVYLLSGMADDDDLLARLGRHRRTDVCLYVRRLDDVDLEVLDELITRSVAHIDQVEADAGAVPRLSDMPPRQP